MRFRYPLFFLACLSSAVVGSPSQAQQTADAIAPIGQRQPKEISAVRRASPIRIDGRIAEEEWAGVPPESNFIQRTPNPGRAASEPTDVRITYDDDAIYIAARMYDSRPDSIVAPLARRDAAITSDWINVVIDSYDDRRTAFHFSVNPRGVKRDIYHSGISEDPGWDAVWDAEASVDSIGWSAELRIPFSQLRFRPVQDGEWGINFYRRLSRREEYSHWAPYLPSDPSFIAGFGRLRGLSGIRPRLGIELQPYLSGTILRSPSRPGDPFGSANDTDASAGVDLRASLPLGMRLAATVNPDFGQVEVDPAVINLSAFETFYPEQRPFFVEGSGIFQFGQVRSHHAPSTGSVVHTRRIGRAPQGFVAGDFVDMPDQSTILGAVKVGGQLPSGWSIGVMDALTDEEIGRFSAASVIERAVVEPRTNYLVGRVRRDWSASGSSLGAIATMTNRHLTGNLATQLRSESQVGGLDGILSWADRSWTLSGYLAASRVRGSAPAIAATQRSSARYLARPDATHLTYDPTLTSLSGYDAAIAVSKEAGSWIGSLRYDQTSPGFEPNDLGFRGRSDVRWLSGALGTTRSRPGRWTRTTMLHLTTASAWNFGGDRIFHEAGLSGNATLQSLWRVSASAGYGPRAYNDRLTRGGPLAVRPEQWSLSSTLGSDSNHPFFLDVSASATGSEIGDRTNTLRVTASYRPSAAIRLSFSPRVAFVRDQRQFVRSVDDALATHTLGRRYVFARLEQRTLSMEGRASWTFTPRLSFDLFVQPLLGAGDFSDYKEMRAPRELELDVYGRDLGTITTLADGRLEVDPDGAGEATSFTIGDAPRQLDFNLQSLRGNAVLRWEFRPGSALYLVWQQDRSGEDTLDDLAVGRDIESLLRLPGRNAFLIKGTYLIG